MACLAPHLKLLNDSRNARVVIALALQPKSRIDAKARIHLVEHPGRDVNHSLPHGQVHGVASLTKAVREVGRGLVRIPDLVIPHTCAPIIIGPPCLP